MTIFVTTIIHRFNCHSILNISKTFMLELTLQTFFLRLSSLTNV